MRHVEYEIRCAVFFVVIEVVDFVVVVVVDVLLLNLLLLLIRDVGAFQMLINKFDVGMSHPRSE